MFHLHCCLEQRKINAWVPSIYFPAFNMEANVFLETLHTKKSLHFIQVKREAQISQQKMHILMHIIVYFTLLSVFTSL